MKFFVAFAALVAVALATPTLYHKPGSDQEAQIEAIIAAIQSPNTDPATAALLEQQLQQIMGSLLNPEPIVVGPTPVEQQPIIVGPGLVDGNEPISVGPILVEGQEPIIVGPGLIEGNEPISVGPVIVDESVISGPVSPVPVPAPAVPETSSAPLVQIILNINQAAGAPGVVGSPVVEAPAQLPDLVIVDQSPESVNIVDQAPDTVNIVDQAPESVNIVDQTPESVNVVEQIPESVNVVQPIMPAPVINLPESLN